MNDVEDEYHFLLVCPCYRNLRNTYLPKYYCHWPTIQKFKNLMNSDQCNVLCKLARYIYMANLKRESLLK